MTRALTILCKSLKCLVNEGDIVFIDVEAQQPKSSSGGATDTVQEQEGLAHKVVVGFGLLIP